MSALEKLVSLTKVFHACLDSQCAEDLFSAGLETEDDGSVLEQEELPENERLMNAKEKYELSNHSISDLWIVFDRLKKSETG